MPAQGKGACPNIGAGHARPVALSSHNAAMANAALNDTLTDGRRMHRPYRNCHPAIRDCPYAWWWFVL